MTKETINYKLDVKISEVIKERLFVTSKKDEIRMLNRYIDDIMLILEPIQRVTIGIKLNEFLGKLDKTIGYKSARQLKDKFIKELQ